MNFKKDSQFFKQDIAPLPSAFLFMVIFVLSRKPSSFECEEIFVASLRFFSHARFDIYRDDREIFVFRSTSVNFDQTRRIRKLCI